MLPIWAGFILAVMRMLALDLGVFHRKDDVAIFSPRRTALRCTSDLVVSPLCVCVRAPPQSHPASAPPRNTSASASTAQVAAPPCVTARGRVSRD